MKADDNTDLRAAVNSIVPYYATLLNVMLPTLLCYSLFPDFDFSDLVVASIRAGLVLSTSATAPVPYHPYIRV